MGVLTGRERRQFAPEPTIPPYPGAQTATSGGLSSSAAGALVIPTVWACVSLIANAVSTLPLQTFRRTGDVPARMTDPSLIVSPDGVQTQSEWLHSVMVSVLLRGNAYGRIAARDAMQRPSQIVLLNPDVVQVRINEQGATVYTVAGKTVPAADIWHFRGLTIPGTVVGLSPISYAQATLGLDAAARKFASDWLNAGGMPVGIVKTNQQITQDQAATLKSRWMEATANRSIVAMGDGVEFDTVKVAANESQFLETLQADVAQIARFFSVPPEMVGGSGGNSMTYSNVEQRSLDFLTYCLAFWLKRLEDSLFPLLPQPQFVAFDRSALTATDLETQAKVDVQLIAGRIQTRDEIRRRRNLPPMTPEQIASLSDVPDLIATPLGAAKALPPPAPAPEGASDA